MIKLPYNSGHLPKHWCEVTLDDIAKWGSGGTPKSGVKEYYNGDIPWLIIGDLNDGYVHSSEKKITIEGLSASSACIVEPESVLVAMYGSIGKLGINKIPVATNQAIAFTKFLPPDVLNWYLFYYLLCMRSSLHSVGKGGTQKNISQTVLKVVPFPLPPLNEQKRIVEKIEALFSEIDAGVASLQQARTQLGVYRQALLKKAFTGELTAQWRLSARERAQAGAALEDVVPESTSKWFTYIIECEGGSYYVGSTGNLRQRWLQHCNGEGAEWTKSNAPQYLVHFEAFDSQEEALKREKDLKTGFGRTWRKREVKAGRIKPLLHNSKNKSAQPVRGESAHGEDMQADEALQTGEQLFERIRQERQARYQQQLDDWKAAVQAWEADGKEGKKPAKPKKPKDIAVISSEALAKLPSMPVGWSYFPFGSLLSVSSGGGLTASKMSGGDYPVYGGNGVCGYHNQYIFEDAQLIIGRVGAKCGVVHITKPKSWVTDNALVADFLIQSYDMAYFQLMLGFFDLNKLSVSTAQPVVSGAKLNPLAIPYCSLPEQKEIVRLLEAQFEAIEQNEREIDTALARTEALRQSILKKAFSGQLVPQDPKDEPASVLLDRIRQEREAAAATKKVAKKYTKNRARKKTSQLGV